MRLTLAICAVATLLAGFSGSILFIALPGIAAEFHADVPALARFGATLSLGSVAALPLAVVADHRHRGAAAAVAIAGFSAASLASALSPNLATLGAARLAAVCFETLVLAVAVSATMEAVGAANRGKAASLLALCAGVGAGLSVVGYPLVTPHWRLLYFVAGIGLCLAPIGLRIPSRPRQADEERGVRTLLDTPWRSRLAALAAAAALGSVLYEPANFFSVLFGSRRLGLSAAALSAVVAASGIAAVAGFLVGGAASDRFGRRSPVVVLLVLSALLAAASFSPAVASYIAANLLWSALAGAAAPMLEAWTAELVPSRARVTAFTATAVAGAIGGVTGLQLVAGLSPAWGIGG
ncbi:MAG TPA: MFS transporter, partial [Candidatus Dormibacteraeota bacterium]